VHVNNEWRQQKAKAKSRTSTAGHVREKEDANPYYSAFCTEQEPASLASKKFKCLRGKQELPIGIGPSFINCRLISIKFIQLKKKLPPTFNFFFPTKFLIVYIFLRFNN